MQDEDPAEVRAGWIDEIEFRMAAIERGEVTFMAGDEVLDRLKTKVSA